MAQPFLLEPDAKAKSKGGNQDDYNDDPDAYFDITAWSPPVAHTLECPTAFPLIRYADKNSVKFVCSDCDWEWVVA